MLPEIGSRWYWSGKHWTVIEHTTKDGEPAVALKGSSGKRTTVIARLFERKALPSVSA